MAGVPSPFHFGLEFRTCNVTPFLSSSSSSSQHKQQHLVFSNGKCIHFGFILSPTENETFYESLKHFIKRLSLSFQVINRKNVIVLAKRDTSFTVQRVNGDIIVAATESLKVSHVYHNTSLLLLLQFSFTPPVPKHVSSHALSLRSNNDDEAEIRNAIDNPTYKHSNITPRKGLPSCTSSHTFQSIVRPLSLPLTPTPPLTLSLTRIVTKGSLLFTLIEPIRVDVSATETTSESTIIQLSIKNTHPTIAIAISR